MAKAVYVGVDTKARKMKKAYIGIGGKARKVKKMYIGDSSGKARLCYSAELELAGTPTALVPPRCGAQATTVGNYAVFVGGYGNNYKCLRNVDAYSASLTKSRPAVTNILMYDHAAATIGNYALFASGAERFINGWYNEFENQLNIYDASLTHIVGVTTLSKERRGIGAATVGNYALFAGGTISNNDDSNGLLPTVDGFDTSLTLTRVTALSTARAHTKGTSVGKYAIFAGGSGMTTVDVYNASLTRTTATALKSAANIDAAATIGNYAIFVGDSATADIYDASLTRTNATILSTARTGLAAATVGDYAVFNGHGIADYCDASLTRSTMDTSQQGQARYDMASTTVGGYALFAGGRSGSGFNTFYDCVEAYTA